MECVHDCNESVSSEHDFSSLSWKRNQSLLNVIEVPSDGVDRDSGGESGHRLKISLLALRSF